MRQGLPTLKERAEGLVRGLVAERPGDPAGVAGVLERIRRLPTLTPGGRTARLRREAEALSRALREEGPPSYPRDEAKIALLERDYAERGWQERRT